VKEYLKIVSKRDALEDERDVDKYFIENYSLL